MQPGRALLPHLPPLPCFKQSLESRGEVIWSQGGCDDLTANYAEKSFCSGCGDEVIAEEQNPTATLCMAN